VYAVGNFDGVHIAHRRLFHIAKDLGHGAPLCAVTFDGLTKDGGRLTEPHIRENLLRDAGADAVLTLDFASVKDISATDFVLAYLLPLSPGGIVCGENFRFGHGGAGDAALLEKLLSPMNIPVKVADTVTLDGVPVSTTGIKGALALGDTHTARKMLGRRYFIEYPVTEGKKLGRRIGTPTANQLFAEGAFIPRHGVYATAVTADGVRMAGVTNIGIRPTLDDGDHVTAETYIPGYTGDLYGCTLRVEFLRYLREECCFTSAEELAEKIISDGEEARRIFAADET